MQCRAGTWPSCSTRRRARRCAGQFELCNASLDHALSPLVGLQTRKTAATETKVQKKTILNNQVGDRPASPPPPHPASCSLTDQIAERLRAIQYLFQTRVLQRANNIAIVLKKIGMPDEVRRAPATVHTSSRSTIVVCPFVPGAQGEPCCERACAQPLSRAIADSETVSQNRFCRRSRTLCCVGTRLR